MTLSPAGQRVLGALIEKEIATPETYPLSLNSLQAAANQRSSRDPVMDLSDQEIRSALDELDRLALIAPVRDARVPKFEHRARTVFQLRRDETAILCLLLLRGPQTPGELRARADRLFAFDGLDSVVATLDRLANPDRLASPDRAPAGSSAPFTGSLTAMLPRQPGARESRYTHLLGDPPLPPFVAAERESGLPSPNAARIAELEHRLLALEQRVENLIDRLENRTPPPQPSDAPR